MESGILKYHPKRFALAIQTGRSKTNLNDHEIAKRANVDDSSVGRVGDPDANPGIMTSIAVGEALGLVEAYQPEDDALVKFAQTLVTDIPEASQRFDEMVFGYLCAVGGPFLPKDEQRPASVMQLCLANLFTVEPFSQLPYSDYPDDGTFRRSPLLADIGIVSWSLARYLFGLYIPDSLKPYRMFWVNLAKGRSKNVRARTLAEGTEALLQGARIAKGEKKKAADFLPDFVEQAVLNHRALEQVLDRVSMQQSRSSLMPAEDTWRMIHVFNAMRQFVRLCESYPEWIRTWRRR